MNSAPAPSGFAPGSHPIAAHGGGAFAFAGMSHAGSILATPRGVRALEAGSVEDLDEHALAPLIVECVEAPDRSSFSSSGRARGWRRSRKR